MKISEVIKVLEQAHREVGDVEFIVATEVDGRFCMEFNRTVEIIGVPKDDGTEETVVATLNFDFDQVEDEDGNTIQ